MGSKEMRLKLMEWTPTKETKTTKNNEDTIKLIQNDADKNRKEKLNHDEDETTSDNSDDKNDVGEFSQINNKMVVSQELQCDVKRNVLMKIEPWFMSKHGKLHTITSLKV